MRKILISLVLGIMLCSNVFAQMNSSNHGFSKKVDITTEAGKWMVDVYLPYADKIMQAASKTIHWGHQQGDLTGLSEQEIGMKIQARPADYYKAVQSITPPEELRVYHEKYLRALEVMSSFSQNMVSMDLAITDSSAVKQVVEQGIASEVKMKQLYDEAVQEITSVFRQHGVPDDIIAVLVETSTVDQPSGHLHYALHDSLSLLRR